MTTPNIKTLAIVSYPNYEQSSTFAFLKHACLENVQFRHLEKVAGIDFNAAQGPSTQPSWPLFNADEERDLILACDRLIFIFPMYWYGPPALMKLWLDQVFDTAWIDKVRFDQSKQVGIIVSTGTNQRAFQAGAEERFTISELTRSFEALSNYCYFDYLPPFHLAQFNYLNDSQKRKKLIEYQVYLTGEGNGLLQKTDWLINELEKKKAISTDDIQKHTFDLLIERMGEQKEEIRELTSLITKQERFGGWYND